MVLVGLPLFTKKTLAQPKPQGTLVIAMPTLYEEGFLPDIGNSGQIYLWEIVYDYLIFTNMKTRDPIPGLATKWEYSNNYRDFTLWLRKGVRWQEGWGELTAEDVKYSFERIMKKGSTNDSAAAFRERIKSIEVIGSHQLVIHLQKTDEMFWMYMTIAVSPYTPIVCKRYIEKVGEEEAMKKPIGSGPYRLVEHKFGDYLKFEALDEHWRLVPEFKYLVVRIVPEESSAVAMLKAGEIDVTGISTTRIAELKKAGFKISLWPSAQTFTFAFGGLLSPQDSRYDPRYHHKDPWADVRVREAMNIAIDREAVVKGIFHGAAVPETIAIMVPGFDKLKPYPYDPQRAKQLLTKAGFPNGFRLKITSGTFVGAPEFQNLIEAVAGYWDAIGLKVEIVPMSWAVVRPQIGTGKTQGLIYNIRVGFFDDWGQRALNYYYPGGTVPHFQSPELTALIDKVLREADYEKAKVIWMEIAKYLHSHYVNVVPVNSALVWTVGTKVGQWPSNLRDKPNNIIYIRHAKPLNTYRLFEIE